MEEFDFRKYIYNNPLINEEVKGEELAMKAKMILKNLLAAGPVELDDKKLVDIMLTMGLRTDKDFKEFIEINKGKIDEPDRDWETFLFR